MSASPEVASHKVETVRRRLEFSKKIYDNVHGYIDITEEERLLIDSPIFQRLRRVAHLGLADFVYPGATHSRFSHSIGSLHVMTKIAMSLVDDEILEDDDVSELRLAALLHDVGHYPFSHVLEGTMRNIAGDPAKHEQLGVFLLRKTSLGDSVGKICKLDNIVAILEGNFREPPLFQYLTSSSLDVDKIDYLQRDSVHTGVAYGAFDVNRLLSCLEPDSSEEPTTLVVTKKGQQAIEDFLLGRYHMFQSVYHHKSVVAFELMLDRIADTLIRNGTLEDLPKIKESIQGDEGWFGDYDDAYVWQVFKANKLGNSVASQLVRKLLSRDSLKMADQRLQLTESLPTKMMEDLAKETLPSWLSKQTGVEPEWIFYKEQPRVTFLEGEPDRTVYLRTEEGIKPIIEEPTSIIKKIWESRYKADRIYTRDNESKEKIEAFLKKYKSAKQGK